MESRRRSRGARDRRALTGEAGDASRRKVSVGVVSHRVVVRRCGHDAEIRLLTHTHGTLSGPATKKVLEREFEIYGHPDYVRLAGISVAHLYNLRKHTAYRKRRQHWTKTAAVRLAIGNGASLARRDSPATCASIPYTRGTSMATRVYTISIR